MGMGSCVMIHAHAGGAAEPLGVCDCSLGCQQQQSAARMEREPAAIPADGQKLSLGRCLGGKRGDGVGATCGK